MSLTRWFSDLAPAPVADVAFMYPLDELPPGWDFVARPTLGTLVIAWMAENLRNDDGAPWRPNATQRRFICDLHALRRNGKFRYRRGSLRMPKGVGKSPLLAALCLAELAGPVAFAGWDEHGRPLGTVRRGAWVVIAGVSEAGTRPIMQSLAALVVGSPLMTQGLDLGLTRVRYGAGLIQLATAGAASLEGIRPSFVVCDEVGHWTPGRHGHELWEVLARSAAKVPGSRMVDATNAHAPGEDSIGERLADAWADMSEDDPETVDVLWYCEEAAPDVDLADLDRVRVELERLYRDALWVDLDALIALLLDSSTRPEEWRRFYLNQSTSDSSKWTTAAGWDACADPTMAPLALGDKVVLGIDPAMKRDSTALVAVRIEDGAPFLLWLGPAPLDVDGLNKAVDEAFRDYRVMAFGSDVHGGEPLLPLWRAKYAARVTAKASPTDPIAYDHRANVRWLVREAERLQAEIEAGTFRYYPEPGADVLRKHVLAAVETEIPQGRYFAKPARGSQYKVDALAALLTARIMRTFYLKGTNQ